MSANVKGDYLETLREKRDLVFPITGAGTQAVDE
jgi:hypothetical protein